MAAGRTCSEGRWKMTAPTPDPDRPLRWDPYLLKSGPDFAAYWEEYLGLAPRNMLFILGCGFDPRSCVGLDLLLAAGGAGRRDCMMLSFDEGVDSPDPKQVEVTTTNKKELLSLVRRVDGQVDEQTVKMWSGEGPSRRRVSSKNASGVVATFDRISPYSTIVMDISAMPRSVYFSLIARILHLLDRAFDSSHPDRGPRFYVVVSENPDLDNSIRGVDLDDDARYIPGLGAAVDAEATAEIPRVWMPILGEGHEAQLGKVYQLVNPGEICPVLPSPARNPRRADDILTEYRQLLFDSWRIEPRNLVYGSELNPFDVYRQLTRSSRQYSTALNPVGGCKVVFSAHSSKLTSLGALLATYQLRSDGLTVGLAHVEPRTYESDLASAASVSNSIPVAVRLA